jgi:hypothetical protein
MFLDIADENILKFVAIMQTEKVRYMLIGGMAVNYYGVNRTTQDMDLWLAPTTENKYSFMIVLQEMGYQKEELEDLEQADFTIPQVFSVWIGSEPLDCLTFVHKSLDFDDAEKNMKRLHLQNEALLNIVSLDYLREMKIKSHRPKDWHDVSLLDKIIQQKRNTQ